MTPKQLKYIAFIDSYLKKGVLSFKKVKDPFQKKFGLSEVTFNRYWKIANASHKKIVEEASKKLEEDFKGILISKNENDILCAIEKQVFLSNVVRSETEKTVDRIKAVVELNRMHGDIAPTEVNVNTDQEFEKKLSQLSVEELRALASKMND